MNRRELLRAGAAAYTLSGMPSWLRAQSASPATLSLSIDPSGEKVNIPSDFTGLSYEAAQLANPGYFSAKNKDLVGLVKRLGAKGVLRIGGNTSDFAIWTAQSNPVASPERSAPVGPDAGLNIGKTTKVTPEAIDELRTFLEATGWSLIYGINLGHGSPERAAEEAAYVTKRIGDRLLALQIGNEADLYFRNGMRNAQYGYADYFAEWQRFADVVRKVTPNAPLAGPDVGNHIDWVESFSKQAKDVKMLTSHYYAEGPPSNPASNIDRLLRPHEKNRDNMLRLVAIGKAANLPYRMAEGNSCYHGGKEGVSDVFASALWGADYMMSMAQWGVTGVNFHGGGQGFYTPIAGGGTQPFEARPLYYGMLFFKEFAQGAMIPVNLAAGNSNVSAYASLAPSRKLHIAVINKNENDVHVDISAEGLRGAAQCLTLRAPAIDSTVGVTFGGGTVTADGSWIPKELKSVQVKNGRLSVDVAKISASLFSFEDALHA